MVDQGIGIPIARAAADLLEVLSCRLGQPPSGGAGLGLFIAQGLVAAMGGRIWVDSAEGRGLGVHVRAARRAAGGVK